MNEKKFLYVEWSNDIPKISHREMKLTEDGWAVRNNDGEFHVTIKGDSDYVPPHSVEEAIEIAITKERMQLDSLRIEMDSCHERLLKLENLKDEVL